MYDNVYDKFPRKLKKRILDRRVSKSKLKLMPLFESTHKLYFEVAPWEFDGAFLRFRVGTCDGLYCTNEKGCGILAVTNSNPGNGHFDDVLEWFEYSLKLHNKTLQVLEVWNKRLKKHLIEKRGFVDIGNDNVEKVFNKVNT